jgi:hypothetical protein
MATKNGQAITAALSDKKVVKSEVDELIALAMANKTLSAAEAKELKGLLKKSGKKLEPDARATLEAFLAANAPATESTSSTTADYFANLRDAFEQPKRTTPFDPCLETVFTPGDAGKAAEYRALDEVIEARKADSKTYPADANPYRIEYAIYNLTDDGVIDRLGEAARLGVKVQVLVDAGSIAPSKWYNTLVKELTAEGFTFERSNLGLTDEQRQSAQLIGVEMPGIFHTKTRYFSYPDPKTGELKEKLLTGSLNPETASHQNDEVLHTVHDKHLIQQYRYFYEACRDNRKIENVWNDDSALNVMFTAPMAQGPRAVDKIFDLIDAENELICLSVFTLRNVADSDKEKLVDRLKAAKERGCEVVVLTDQKQADGVDAEGASTGTDDKTDELLAKAGIPTYTALNKSGPYNAMHLKACLFGLKDMKVVTDAGNWTYSVMGNEKTGSWNAESVLFVDSARLDENRTGEQYLAEFMRLLRKYGPQNPDQPGAEQLIAELQQMPNWPKVKVDFSVIARTNLGQEVFISGNTKELGSWGKDGPGLKLETDPSTYPDWQGLDVELPLGAALEYKIVKRDSNGRLQWEPGQNTVMVVDPSDSGRGSTDDMKVDDRFDGDP